MMQCFSAAMTKKAALIVALLCGTVGVVAAQSSPTERVFPQSKSAVEKALKQLQGSMSGRLPTLEGFAQAGARPLSRYQRGFFQCITQVRATPEGGSIVRVSAKVTAWYAGPSASGSGYEALTSNGRLETDVLDQLSDQLASSASNQEKRPDSAVSASSLPVSSSSLPVQSALPVQRSLPGQNSSKLDEATVSAPVPGPATKEAFSAPANPVLSAAEIKASAAQPGDSQTSSKTADLHAEIGNLEEVLKNQAHPRNLVAVKKTGTPVVGSPSLTGKTLFLASAQDEFEMLDFSADWVHVRVSGLSRGWIWRTSVEMPEGIPDVPSSTPTRATTVADLFQVSREETAQFPGDWVALRGKNVMIISVQKIRDNDPQDGPTAKLEFAKSLLDQHYTELARSQELSGLVMIFDSADGGMIAATLPTIQRWKSGALTDAAMWHQCYFDPPETFTISSAQGGR